MLVLIGATIAAFVYLHYKTIPEVYVKPAENAVEPWTFPTGYQSKVEKITHLLLAAPTSRPTSADEIQLFDYVQRDSDFRIRVRAMAVLPFVPDREKAIDILIASVHEHDPKSTGNGNVPLYAATYLADMKAERAIPDIEDWIVYLQKYSPYGEPMGSMVLKKAMEDLSRIKSVSTQPTG